MITQSDKDYLEDITITGIPISNGIVWIKWYNSCDDVMKVARILDDARMFKDTSEVIAYFEKPQLWEGHIEKLIKG